MMARRHNNLRSQSPSQEEGKSDDDGHRKKQQRNTPNLLLARRAIITCQNMSSVHKIKLLIGVVMLIGVISLLTNNIGGQQRLRPERSSGHSAAAEAELLQALYGLPLPATSKELSELNDELAGIEPKFILQWAHHAVLTEEKSSNLRSQEKNKWNAHPLVQVTSFGPTGLVILDQLSKYKLLDSVPVITMDTLHLFKESYTFFDTIQAHYNSSLHLTITKPVHIATPPELDGDSVFKGYMSSKAEFNEVYSSTLWQTDPQFYTKVTKIDPLQQKLEEWQTVMWMTGRRRSQGGEREELKVLEFEPYLDEVNRRRKSAEDGDDNPFHSSKGRWKLNPLAYWSYDQVWSYIRENEVPYNILYDLGFTSIGDEMTSTLPKKSHSGEPSYERSGRFSGLNRTECGLHSHLGKIKALKKEKEVSGEEWTVPELECDRCIELTEDNFLETVHNDLEEGSLLLLEFYSPFCGTCQEFAPVLNRLANYQIPNVKVARFDVTEQKIPKYNGEEEFQVEATPTLYLVSNSQSFHAEQFYGKHDFNTILRWITEQRKIG